jgi:hypothetical protein
MMRFTLALLRLGLGLGLLLRRPPAASEGV